MSFQRFIALRHSSQTAPRHFIQADASRTVFDAVNRQLLGMAMCSELLPDDRREYRAFGQRCKRYELIRNIKVSTASEHDALQLEAVSDP